MLRALIVLAAAHAIAATPYHILERQFNTGVPLKDRPSYHELKRLALEHKDFPQELIYRINAEADGEADEELRQELRDRINAKADGETIKH